MLNLERLRALHAVAERGSVRAAAQALNVTTSAISQQLAKLEDETGQRLIERRGRGVRLTDAAAMLVTYTSEAISILARAESELDARRTEVVGRLTVAAFPTAVRGLVPRALERLHTCHPRLEVVVREQELGESISRLVRGDLDLVIAQDWTNSPLALPEGLARAPIVEDVADVALPAGHPLAAQTVVTLARLANERWIAFQPGTICHDWLLYTLRSLGHEPTVAHTAGEHATQLALVGAGLGCSIIPRLGRDAVPAGVRIVSVKPSLHRRIYGVWRTEASRRRAIAAAIDAFRSSAASAPATPTPPAGRVRDRVRTARRRAKH